MSHSVKFEETVWYGHLVLEHTKLLRYLWTFTTYMSLYIDYIILSSAEMQTVESSLFLLADCMSDHIRQEYTCRTCTVKIYSNILSFIWLEHIVLKSR